MLSRPRMDRRLVDERMQSNRPPAMRPSLDSRAPFDVMSTTGRGSRYNHGPIGPNHMGHPMHPGSMVGGRPDMSQFEPQLSPPQYAPPGPHIPMQGQPHIPMQGPPTFTFLETSRPKQMPSQLDLKMGLSAISRPTLAPMTVKEKASAFKSFGSSKTKPVKKPKLNKSKKSFLKSNRPAIIGQAPFDSKQFAETEAGERAITPAKSSSDQRTISSVKGSKSNEQGVPYTTFQRSKKGVPMFKNYEDSGSSEFTDPHSSEYDPPKYQDPDDFQGAVKNATNLATVQDTTTDSILSGVDPKRPLTMQQSKTALQTTNPNRQPQGSIPEGSGTQVNSRNKSSDSDTSSSEEVQYDAPDFATEKHVPTTSDTSSSNDAQYDAPDFATEKEFVAAVKAAQEGASLEWDRVNDCPIEKALAPQIGELSDTALLDHIEMLLQGSGSLLGIPDEPETKQPCINLQNFGHQPMATHPHLQDPGSRLLGSESQLMEPYHELHTRPQVFESDFSPWETGPRFQDPGSRLMASRSQLMEPRQFETHPHQDFGHQPIPTHPHFQDPGSQLMASRSQLMEPHQFETHPHPFESEFAPWDTSPQFQESNYPLRVSESQLMEPRQFETHQHPFESDFAPWETSPQFQESNYPLRVSESQLMEPRYTHPQAFESGFQPWDAREQFQESDYPLRESKSQLIEPNNRLMVTRPNTSASSIGLMHRQQSSHALPTREGISIPSMLYSTHDLVCDQSTGINQPPQTPFKSPSKRKKAQKRKSAKKSPKKEHKHPFSNAPTKTEPFQPLFAKRSVPSILPCIKRSDTNLAVEEKKVVVKSLADKSFSVLADIRSHGSKDNTGQVSSMNSPDGVGDKGAEPQPDSGVLVADESSYSSPSVSVNHSYNMHLMSPPRPIESMHSDFELNAIYPEPSNTNLPVQECGTVNPISEPHSMSTCKESMTDSNASPTQEVDTHFGKSHTIQSCTPSNPEAYLADQAPVHEHPITRVESTTKSDHQVTSTISKTEYIQSYINSVHNSDSQQDVSMDAVSNALGNSKTMHMVSPDSQLDVSVAAMRTSLWASKIMPMVSSDRQQDDSLAAMRTSLRTSNSLDHTSPTGKHAADLGVEHQPDSEKANPEPCVSIASSPSTHNYNRDKADSYTIDTSYKQDTQRLQHEDMPRIIPSKHTLEQQRQQKQKVVKVVRFRLPDMSRAPVSKDADEDNKTTSSSIRYSFAEQPVRKKVAKVVRFRLPDMSRAPDGTTQQSQLDNTQLSDDQPAAVKADAGEDNETTCSQISSSFGDEYVKKNVQQKEDRMIHSSCQQNEYMKYSIDKHSQVRIVAEEHIAPSSHRSNGIGNAPVPGLVYDTVKIGDASSSICLTTRNTTAKHGNGTHDAISNKVDLTRTHEAALDSHIDKTQSELTYKRDKYISSEIDRHSQVSKAYAQNVAMPCQGDNVKDSDSAPSLVSNATELQLGPICQRVIDTDVVHQSKVSYQTHFDSSIKVSENTSVASVKQDIGAQKSSFDKDDLIRKLDAALQEVHTLKASQSAKHSQNGYSDRKVIASSCRPDNYKEGRTNQLFQVSNTTDNYIALSCTRANAIYSEVSPSMVGNGNQQQPDPALQRGNVSDRQILTENSTQSINSSSVIQTASSTFQTATHYNVAESGKIGDAQSKHVKATQTSISNQREEVVRKLAAALQEVQTLKAQCLEQQLATKPIVVQHVMQHLNKPSAKNETRSPQRLRRSRGRPKSKKVKESTEIAKTSLDPSLAQHEVDDATVAKREYHQQYAVIDPNTRKQEHIDTKQRYNQSDRKRRNIMYNTKRKLVVRKPPTDKPARSYKRLNKSGRRQSIAPKCQTYLEMQTQNDAHVVPNDMRTHRKRRPMSIKMNAPKGMERVILPRKWKIHHGFQTQTSDEEESVYDLNKPFCYNGVSQSVVPRVVRRPNIFPNRRNMYIAPESSDEDEDWEILAPPPARQPSVRLLVNGQDRAALRKRYADLSAAIKQERRKSALATITAAHRELGIHEVQVDVPKRRKRPGLLRRLWNSMCCCSTDVDDCLETKDHTPRPSASSKSNEENFQTISRCMHTTSVETSDMCVFRVDGCTQTPRENKGVFKRFRKCATKKINTN